ncbi:cathepsin C [Striga asiatica]|uniref:Cathepsin C n=1 Tax=Striga asiatica TaxID=4170 RepID=A0A5A7PZG0_STRAF|nr:cathepsin C [Striga asiatica]
MDAVPECNDVDIHQFDTIQLNAKIRDVLEDVGLAFEEDYETEDQWDADNHEKFMLRRRYDHSLMVVKKLQGYILNRSAEPSGEVFDFAKGLRSALGRTSLVALIRVRVSLRILSRNQISFGRHHYVRRPRGGRRGGRARGRGRRGHGGRQGGFEDPHEQISVHVCLLTDYGSHNGTEYFEIMKSWGEDCSDNGFRWILIDDIIERMSMRWCTRSRLRSRTMSRPCSE